MGKIIELKKVNKWFDKFQVLKDIDLDVAPQEKIVICGPSGSGKSTLIRCINRLEEHQEGNIVVDLLKVDQGILGLGRQFELSLNFSLRLLQLLF